MDCNRLEELIDEYLEYLSFHRGYSKEIIQTYEIPLIQIRDNCQWREKNGIIYLDITIFRHLIAKSGQRAIKKKLNSIYLFVEYLKRERGLNIQIVGDTRVSKLKKNKSLKEILDEFTAKERLLMELFYCLDLKLTEIASLKLNDIDLENGTIKGYKLYPQLKNTINIYFQINSNQESDYLFGERDKLPNARDLRNTLQHLSRRVKIPQGQIRDSFLNLYKIDRAVSSNIA